MSTSRDVCLLPQNREDDTCTFTPGVIGGVRLGLSDLVGEGLEIGDVATDKSRYPTPKNRASLAARRRRVVNIVGLVGVVGGVELIVGSGDLRLVTSIGDDGEDG